MSIKVMMTWEGTADMTRWGGLEVKEVGMTVETTTNSEAIYYGYPPPICAFIASIFETTIGSELKS